MWNSEILNLQHCLKKWKQQLSNLKLLEIFKATAIPKPEIIFYAATRAAAVPGDEGIARCDGARGGDNACGPPWPKSMFKTLFWETKLQHKTRMSRQETRFWFDIWLKTCLKIEFYNFSSTWTNVGRLVIIAGPMQIAVYVHLVGSPMFIKS